MVDGIHGIGRKDILGLNTENKANDTAKLEDISILYTTTQQESDRTSFDTSFTETPVSMSKQGEKFLNGLIENKNNVCLALGLTSEKYDNMACIALALASQETGMGEESGYVGENTGLGYLFRWIGKNVDCIFGGASASSGLTQMKIYDFINTDGKLSDKQKDALNKFGIKAGNVADSNLYDNPDKSAIATIVVLDSLMEQYNNYTNVLNNAHSSLSESMAFDGLTEAQRVEKGQEMINSISSAYESAPQNIQKEIRQTFKQWLLSNNNSKISDRGDREYNEEYQMEKLNTLLGEYSNTHFNTEDLNYIRYALTAENQEMNTTEYCAYAWNKGTGTSGMQLDRLLADKVGTILATPEDFDYDQFTVNVSTLTDLYAKQMSEQNEVFSASQDLDDLIG